MGIGSFLNGAGSALGGMAGAAVGGPLGAIAGSDLSAAGDFIHNKFLGGDQARAARGAAAVQTTASGHANDQATGTYNQGIGYQQPFYSLGVQNAQGLSNRYQSGGFNPGALGQYNGQGAQGFNQQTYTPGTFNPGDLTQDPGYQFRMNQGINAVQNSAAARGMLHSGNTLQAINDYAQGQASNEMNNAYNRFADQQNRGMQNNQFQNQFGLQNNQANRNFGYQNMYDTYNTGANNMANQFNHGAQLAGYGQTAAANMGNLGQNYSQQYGNNLLGGANAQAAGMIGAANAQTQGINNLMNLGMQGATAYFGGK